MIKIVALIDRRESLGLAEFREEYARHAALCWSLAPAPVGEAVVHYVQNHCRDLGSGGAAPYDCVTEIGFADEVGLRLWNNWYLGPDGAEIRADEERFMDVRARVVVVADETRPTQPAGALEKRDVHLNDPDRSA